MKIDNSRFITAAILAALIILDAMLWRGIFSPHPFGAARAYSLGIDSGLIIFPGNFKVMTDAGADSAALEKTGTILGSDNYIDLAFISYPKPGRFGGYEAMLDYYNVGAFLYNGREGEPSAAWERLARKMKEKHIPLVTLTRGDRIRFDSNELDVLAPSAEFAQSADLAETALKVIKSR